MIACARCGHESPDSARFCAACGAVLDHQPVVPTREERKVVTIVFVDLVGSTARAEQLDPEDVRALLSKYHVRVRHELEAHGGTVEKFIGDAVVAVFGAPAAHEDDPERAVRAALAIQEAITELNESEPALELEVRIGVNTGEALVALEARPEAGEGMVSGDVINTAARLQSAAPPGGILVGEQAYRATARVIDYADPEEVQAKGKAAPLIVWQALARRSSFGVEHGAVGRAPLVGREREVALLTDALARVRSDERPQLITLVGVPGIGKSRLVQELWRIVDADPDLITWRQGRSLPYGEGVAYWALGEIVKAQAGILESDDGTVAATKLSSAVADLLPDHSEVVWVDRQLRPLVGLPGGEGQPSRDEAFTARRRFLEALAETRPAVLVFEDLHWADDDLLDFVDDLADRLEAVPLLLVCTARPELLARRPGWGGGKLNSLTLSLAPLSDVETGRLLQTLLDRTVLPAETQAALVRRSEGVPLFAEEYARILESGGESDELPETLQGVVAARIDGLAAPEKALLQDAAVLGKVFWTDALETLAGVDAHELAERLRVLDRQEFVRRERRSAVEGARQYAFLHALVREVAYGQIPRAARSDKHRLTAEWIATLPADRAEDRAETLAHHLESAISYGEAAGLAVDDLRPLAMAALWEAADRAWALNSVARSAALYRRAIDAVPSETVDAELQFRHAHAQMWAEGVSSSTADLSRSIDGLLAAGKNELAAMAMVTLERRLWNQGSPDLDLLRRAHALVADGGVTATRARTLGTVAVRLSIAGRADEALPIAEEAVATARALDDATVLAETMNSLGVAQVNVGLRAEGIETTRRALELALESGSNDVMRCYVNAATFAFELGQVREAAEKQRAGLDLALRLGNKSQADWGAAELVTLGHTLGDWDEAQRDARALGAARAGEGTSHIMDAFLLVTDAAITFAREGRLQRDQLDRALAIARSAAEPQTLLPITSDVAFLLASGGLGDEADVVLAELRGVSRSAGTAHQVPGPWTVSAALGFLLRGQPQLDELPDAPDVPWVVAARLLAEGRAVAAADLLGAIEARTVEAETRLHAARAATELDPATASRQLDLATAFWRRVGATARLAQVDEVRERLRPAAS